MVCSVGRSLKVSIVVVERRVVKLRICRLRMMVFLCGMVLGMMLSRFLMVKEVRMMLSVLLVMVISIFLSSSWCIREIVFVLREW